MAGDELRQADLEREFGGRWDFGYTINNRPRATTRRASPPVWLWADSWTELRDQIVAAIAKRPGLAALTGPL